MASSLHQLATLVRSNVSFRRLWYGSLTSQLGDTVDLVAQTILLLHLTGSAEAVAWRVLAATLTPALVGPWAGVAVDRFSRKTIMIAADVLCGLTVFALLLVTSPDRVWIVYVVTAVRMGLGAFFNPAAKAVTAEVVKRDELITANTITIMTFAGAFAWGAALGGVIASVFDVRVAFLLDALSFFVSAICTASIRVPAVVDAEKPRGSPLRGLGEGLRYLGERLHLALVTLAGAFYGAGGGGLQVLLSLYGTWLFPWGDRGSVSLGMLYAAIGVGSIIGPLVGHRLAQGSPSVMYRLIGPAFLVLAISFVGLSAAPNLYVAVLALMFAYAAVTVVWLYMVALLQMEVPDRLLGRVIALANTGTALTTSLSGYLIGVAADVGDPREAARHLALLMAGVMAPSGVLLAFVLRPPRETAPTAKE